MKIHNDMFYMTTFFSSQIQLNTSSEHRKRAVVMSRVIAGRHDGRRAEERAGYKFSS